MSAPYDDRPRSRLNVGAAYKPRRHGPFASFNQPTHRPSTGGARTTVRVALLAFVVLNIIGLFR